MPSVLKPDWVVASDALSRRYLELQARFEPEAVAQFGVTGYDEAIADFTPGHDERKVAMLEAFLAECETLGAQAMAPALAEDLAIVSQHARNAISDVRLRSELLVPYLGVAGTIFSGLRLLLDDQIAPERRAAAVVRLRRYAGLEPGTVPLSELVEAEVREGLERGRLAPMREELESDLDNTVRYWEGLRELFEKYELDHWAEPMRVLSDQLGLYDVFLRQEVLPRARQDFRLPGELYAFALELEGVDRPPAEVAREAHAAFVALTADMQAIAPEIARQRGFASSDYRAVLSALKAEQVVGEEVIALYERCLREIEAIVRRERLVSMPACEVRIRVASEAESAHIPNPYLEIPRLIDNQGEQGVFVLPLNVPARPGVGDGEPMKLDDFSFAAAAWPVTAHEARPGHELQFATMLESGVSLARAIFSFNSTNCEGWGLYAEYLIEPFMPLAAQLVTMQLRLMRTARAFLDPELQAGTLTPDEARRLLRDEVGLSAAMANSEIERYMFRAPGQAVTYFYGFTRLLELRRELEALLGRDFDALAFHDFILAQGLMPVALLREAALAHFARQGP